MTRQIAGLIKGLIEAGDGTKHFGSLLGYRHHLHEAVKAGLVQVIDGKACVTQAGAQWYEEKSLAGLSGRCTHWRLGQDASQWDVPTGTYEKELEALAEQPEVQDPLNLKCKSTQKRLATLWGFVHAKAQKDALNAARYLAIRDYADKYAIEFLGIQRMAGSGAMLDKIADEAISASTQADTSNSI